MQTNSIYPATTESTCPTTQFRSAQCAARAAAWSNRNATFFVMVDGKVKFTAVVR